MKRIVLSLMFIGLFVNAQSQKRVTNWVDELIFVNPSSCAYDVEIQMWNQVGGDQCGDISHTMLINVLPRVGSSTTVFNVPPDFYVSTIEVIGNGGNINRLCNMAPGTTCGPKGFPCQLPSGPMGNWGVCFQPMSYIDPNSTPSDPSYPHFPDSHPIPVQVWIHP